MENRCTLLMISMFFILGMQPVGAGEQKHEDEKEISSGWWPKDISGKEKELLKKYRAEKSYRSAFHEINIEDDQAVHDEIKNHIPIWTEVPLNDLHEHQLKDPIAEQKAVATNCRKNMEDIDVTIE